MRNPPKSVPEILRELWELLVAYARQETVDPLRNLGRYLGFGLAGSFLMGTGMVLLAMALLRGLQDSTSVFDGFWSWAPYALTVVGLGTVIGVAVSRITKQSGRSGEGTR